MATNTTTRDPLREIEDRLAAKAFLFDAPDDYRCGMQDALEAVRAAVLEVRRDRGEQDAGLGGDRPGSVRAA